MGEKLDALVGYGSFYVSDRTFELADSKGGPVDGFAENQTCLIFFQTCDQECAASGH